MEKLRAAARTYLNHATSCRDDASTSVSFSFDDEASIPTGLNDLWTEIQNNVRERDQLQICEDLIVVQACLRKRPPSPLSSEDEAIVNELFLWASDAAIPSEKFADVLVSDEDPDEETATARGISRLQSHHAVLLIESLSQLLPIDKAKSSARILIALASLSSEHDPWTTPDCSQKAKAVLEKSVAEDRTRQDEPSSLWFSIEAILKDFIKPLFAKTKNPAITSGGRKNFHPIPLARFDGSLYEPETKPWKSSCFYASTVLGWVVAQYQASDRVHLETHFPLLVPPLLALIDDDNLHYKTKGCGLLDALLVPIRNSKSDILRRTNLSSVFEDAIALCLLSLPTITPEDESIQLLGAAYPALLALHQTTHQSVIEFRNTNTATTKTIPGAAKAETMQKEKAAYISSLTKILRTHLIPSYHHISSTNPAETSSLSSSFVSFPYPRLSTLILNQITVMISELQIHTTKYLQEIVPLLYSTLTNPFGTAYPPLLLSAVAATHAVVLNAHPRLWRWRGELFSGLCSCWLHVLEDQNEQRENRAKDNNTVSQGVVGLERLKGQLKAAVFLLKYALENPVPIIVDDLDPGQVDAKESIGNELQALVDADEDLKGLLFGEVNVGDLDSFGVGI